MAIKSKHHTYFFWPTTILITFMVLGTMWMIANWDQIEILEILDFLASNYIPLSR